MKKSIFLAVGMLFLSGYGAMAQSQVPKWKVYCQSCKDTLPKEKPATTGLKTPKPYHRVWSSKEKKYVIEKLQNHERRITTLEEHDAQTKSDIQKLFSLENENSDKISVIANDFYSSARSTTVADQTLNISPPCSLQDAQWKDVTRKNGHKIIFTYIRKNCHVDTSIRTKSWVGSNLPVLIGVPFVVGAVGGVFCWLDQKPKNSSGNSQGTPPPTSGNGEPAGVVTQLRPSQSGAVTVSPREATYAFETSPRRENGFQPQALKMGVQVGFVSSLSGLIQGKIGLFKKGGSILYIVPALSF